jgi:hypothetical protein
VRRVTADRRRLSPRAIFLGVQIEMLRGGWPEEVLTGRYTFTTRRRDGFVQTLFDTAELLTDGLIEKDRRDQLHLRIGGKPSMVVLNGTHPQAPQLPPGIKICAISPVEALLVLVEGPRRQYPTAGAALFAPTRYDVVDHRLGAVIGTLETTGGFIRPARTVVYDPAHRVVGQLTQPLTALLGQWLLVGRNRFSVSVGGVRVARVRQTRRLWAREFRVDLTVASGRLDPRLILACALQKVHGLSDY